MRFSNTDSQRELVDHVGETMEFQRKIAHDHMVPREVAPVGPSERPTWSFRLSLTWKCS